jgi:hypothetical protein
VSQSRATTGSAQRRLPRWWSDAVAAVVVSVVLLGPALGPGYVLSYDMVFVPRMPFTARLLGIDGSVPRSVPSDAVVAALSHVVGGMVAQKLILLGLLVAAGLGAAGLVREHGRAASAIAVVFAVWNPYVASRLWLGQWAILVAYAVLPWLVACAAQVRRGDRRRLAATVVLLAVASLTASGGLIAAATALCVVAWSPAARPSRWRELTLVGLGAVVVNLPWLLPSVLRSGGWPTDPAALDAFAARADTPLGTLGSVLSLGGTWNAQTMPAGRDSWWAAAVLLAMAAVAVAGAIALVRARRRVGWSVGLLVAAVGSVVVAVAASVPILRDGVRAAVSALPALALFRDGTRYLPPWVLLVVVSLAVGAHWLSQRVQPRELAPVVLAFALLAPIVTLVGAAWGDAGALRSTRYPAGWAQAAAAVAAQPGRGDVVALPWASYHRFAWNGDRTVYDPASRWLPAEVVIDDRLLVGDEVLAGEDPRSAAVTALLRGDASLASALAAQGVGWVLVTAETGVPPPPAAWFADMTNVVDTPELTLWQVPDPSATHEVLAAAWLVIAVDLGVVAFVGFCLVIACWPDRAGRRESAASMVTHPPPVSPRESPP